MAPEKKDTWNLETIILKGSLGVRFFGSVTVCSLLSSWTTTLLYLRIDMATFHMLWKTTEPHGDSTDFTENGYARCKVFTLHLSFQKKNPRAYLHSDQSIASICLSKWSSSVAKMEDGMYVQDTRMPVLLGSFQFFFR